MKNLYLFDDGFSCSPGLLVKFIDFDIIMDWHENEIIFNLYFNYDIFQEQLSPYHHLIIEASIPVAEAKSAQQFEHIRPISYPMHFESIASQSEHIVNQGSRKILILHNRCSDSCLPFNEGEFLDHTIWRKTCNTSKGDELLILLKQPNICVECTNSKTEVGFQSKIGSENHLRIKIMMRGKDLNEEECELQSVLQHHKSLWFVFLLLRLLQHLRTILVPIDDINQLHYQLQNSLLPQKILMLLIGFQILQRIAINYSILVHIKGTEEYHIPQTDFNFRKQNVKVLSLKLSCLLKYKLHNHLFVSLKIIYGLLQQFHNTIKPCLLLHVKRFNNIKLQQIQFRTLLLELQLKHILFD